MQELSQVDGFLIVAKLPASTWRQLTATVKDSHDSILPLQSHTLTTDKMDRSVGDRNGNRKCLNLPLETHSDYFSRSGLLVYVELLGFPVRAIFVNVRGMVTKV